MHVYALSAMTRASTTRNRMQTHRPLSLIPRNSGNRDANGPRIARSYESASFINKPSIPVSTQFRITRTIHLRAITYRASAGGSNSVPSTRDLPEIKLASQFKSHELIFPRISVPKPRRTTRRSTALQFSQVRGLIGGSIERHGI